MDKICLKFSLLAGLIMLFLGQATTLSAMGEEQLCDLYMEVTESAVDFFEPLWSDYSHKIPETGFFDFAPYGNWYNKE